jgi:putative aminopeptidase
MMSAAMKSIFRSAVVMLLLSQNIASGQSLDDLKQSLTRLSEIPAVTGHEQTLASYIADLLKKRGLDPKIDVMSNVTVTLGSGEPHRLLVASIDEPGFIVSGITPDGYLRMQRVGTTKPFAYFDQYFEGQRLTIETIVGKRVTGVLAIPSTHLARGGNRAERPFDLSDGYIDIGAKSSAEVSAMGVQILDPVSMEKNVTTLAGGQLSGPFLSDRAGAAILLSILDATAANKVNGSVTFAFTTQEHFGRKGLDRMSVVYEPAEVYFVEPVNATADSGTTTSLATRTVTIDAQAAPAVRRMIQRFEGLRESNLRTITPTPRWKAGTEVVRVGIPIMFYATPVEVIDLKNLQSTIRFLTTIVLSGVS